MKPTLRICIAVLFIAVAQVDANVFTVTNTNGSGVGSLATAISSANSLPGTHTVEFNLPTTDPGYDAVNDWWTILVGNLPYVASGVTVDGYSQPGASMNTADFGQRLNAKIKIRIQLTSSWWGVGGSATIRGLAMVNCKAHGIVVHGSNNWIYGNYFGVNPDGTKAGWQGGYQIWIHGASSGNNTIGSNGDGKNDPGEINVIGNSARQSVTVNGRDAIFRYNYFGVGPHLDDQGSKHGIAVNGGRNLLIEKNIFGYNASDGVNHWNSGTTHCIIRNNWFGTDPGETLRMPNRNGYGVAINTRNVTLEGNVFAYNSGTAIYLCDADHYIIRNNHIYDTKGSAIGMWAWAGGPNQEILVADNHFHNNGGQGITKSGSSGFYSECTFIRNRIYNHRSIGIDLAPQSGPSLNDVDDTDDGDNRALNFPDSVRTKIVGNEIEITFNLDVNDAEAGGLAGYRIEWYANPSPDPTGYGEGQFYLGTVNLQGDVQDYRVTFTKPASVGGGYSVAGTVTEIHSMSGSDELAMYGGTSEFSRVAELKDQSGRIGDLVWFDQNRNGIKEDFEPGIDGVVLSLFDDQNEKIAKALTRKGGFYVFKNVPPGDYRIEIDPATVPQVYGAISNQLPWQVSLKPSEQYLSADFGFPSGETAAGCGQPVLAWYESWFSLDETGQGQRHWSPDYSGGQSDSAWFNISAEFDPAPEMPFLFDSRDSVIRETDILQAWAANVDGFVVDWYGKSSFENHALIGLLNQAESLYETYSDDQFDFNIVVAYNSQSEGSLDENLMYLADSILVHPAYYHTREGMADNDWSNTPRLLFVLDENQSLDPVLFEQAAQRWLPSDVRIVWSWSPDGSQYWQDCLQVADAFYPWCGTGDPQYNATGGLAWDKHILSDYYAFVDTSETDVMGSVWPGLDDREWALGEHRNLDRQSGAIYDSTWALAIRHRADLILIQSWNDFNRSTHIYPSKSHKDHYLGATRDWIANYKEHESCKRTFSDLGLQIPQALWVGHQSGVSVENIADARAAFFRQEFESALDLLLDDPPQVSYPVKPNLAGNHLVFVEGSPTYAKGDDVRGWENAVDDDTDGWDGSTLARGDKEASDPAWAIFRFADNGFYRFNYVAFQVDNGTADDALTADYKTQSFEVWVSVTGTDASDFECIAEIRRRFDGTELEWVRLDRFVKARYVKIRLQRPFWQPGCWRQLVEFQVQSDQKQGALPASEQEMISALPGETRLFPAAPNPFNHTTTVRIELSEPGFVSLVAYDISGRTVATLVEEDCPAGAFQVNWDATEMASGIYFLALQTEQVKRVQKVTLLK